MHKLHSEPHWHHICICSPPPPVILYAVGLGVFLDQQQHFSGFFSLDGAPHDGCLSYGFGISLSAFIINVIATVIGLLAICYKKMCPTKFKYQFPKSD